MNATRHFFQKLTLCKRKKLLSKANYIFFLSLEGKVVTVSIISNVQSERQDDRKPWSGEGSKRIAVWSDLIGDSGERWGSFRMNIIWQPFVILTRRGGRDFHLINIISYERVGFDGEYTKSKLQTRRKGLPFVYYCMKFVL